ncbi:kinesin-like protein KIN-7K, chloroplastic isoform X2 [Ricinus communis]|uniref:Kinesin heavy chain, putative n=1 Tax=Ricinus communis TaxID=3988 RepID=B9SWK1_RICCO|nr:kinesin-like protein KIN-7K, chloroplastic isoform X2 [Ricinus communis]EEF32031.1 kinesin heavy chain, putative [Ricinus communis]|eukprot:XP_002530370.1 kinesin-like protein KIN-7K, chloroplastic isoform X2 [Ricinus communis]
MATKQQGSKWKKTSLSNFSKGVMNSPSSSTTSSSKQFIETSIDGQSSPASSSARSKPQYFYSENVSLDAERSKENVTVTVRFRPLSPREIRQGEEIAWYADGETIVRNEHNPSIAYAYDRVFGPTTTTRHVYDVAAQHVVGGAMEGVNGTIFAYGVTSSGKTHTMHGDQRSPGIIPLAVKDAFSIIQETPNREFLLRVSYLEIYNEVVNDLLNPAGQNLRIREDAQGTYVEGIKEEVVLSPAHALSLIAAGEEHRHVGSTNFNLLSSRSHTIFTLTIESSPCGENNEGEAVNLSQLNLIDLAGSESSKAETTGMRRKEGSYINKSLLTLGTVISKLTDGRATHIPYRDSKLTRLLQSSLSGHGRVSLICTVTPSSSNCEETHNTLKFAHRAKHIEIQAAQNKIIDEKSLIKKYQNEIRSLKEELEQLRRGIVTVPQLKDMVEDDIVLLKQKLEDGQVKLQSRLEQEEEAKAALLSRIQHLTKLILVSSKASQSSRFPHRPGPRRRHSFGEEELAYLPYKRRDLMLDDENIDLYVSLEGNSTETTDDTLKEEKKSRKHGLLNWLKLRKRDSGMGTSTSDRSSGVKSNSTPSTPQAENSNYHTESRFSNPLLTESSPSADLLSDIRLDTEVPEDNFLGQETPSTSIRTSDQIELLREQQKILSGEVALHSSALKRLSEEASRNPQKEQIHVEIKKLNDEIKVKNEQIASLEKQIADSVMASHNKIDKSDASLTIAELMGQLNEKSFELEVKAADNRVIQEQLNQKICECEGLQETIVSLKQQLADAQEMRNPSPLPSYSQRLAQLKSLHEPHQVEKENAATEDRKEDLLRQAQANETEELKQKVDVLTESKEQLELRNQKLAEESSYAKGLASAAAVELKALSEEVSKLMNHNERLSAELASLKSSPPQCRSSSTVRNGRRENHVKRQDQVGPTSELKKELALCRDRELQYEAALMEKDQREADLQSKVEESKHREAYLENELANMWILVAKLKKSHGADIDISESTRDSNS